jgi:2-hydroxy-3-oxopropionate reductase
MSRPTVGFIGLGIMGKPMARNLLAAGYPLVVANRSPGPVEELASDGARAADTPLAVAQASDVVITMLPDSPQVAEVLEGPDGVLAAGREGQLVIDMSTIDPAVAQRLASAAAQRGVAMLDAPVSGGDVGAREGTLSIMVGGDADAFARARPLFEVVGGTIVHVGASGAGQVVKACNQVLVALTIEAVSEALVLGSSAGVDPAVIIEVLSGGLAANRVMEVRRENFLTHTFKPGFRVDLHHKDLGIALSTARAHGVSLPVTAVVDQMLDSLRSKGHGQEDHSALLTVIEDLSNHRIVQEEGNA